MDDLPSCLTLRNINSKRDEQHTRNEKTSDKYFAKNALGVECLSPVALGRRTRKKNYSKPEIHVEGTSLIYQNLFQGADDKDKKQHNMHSSQDEQAASSSKDENLADGIAMKTEDINLMNTPESVNILGDRTGQDIDMNLLESQRSLNPNPWKEIWSVLQDKSLANYPLSTKSVEFVRDISETPFSTRTNAYTKTRRGKPQRIPPLYNTRKTVTHEKAKIPSFDAAVTFNTFFKGGQGTGVPFDKCKECIKLADQSEVSGGHACGKHESKDTKGRTIGLPNITCPPTNRYKSKFRVKLLPLVTKSDSLPNLTSKTTSVPSELIVTAPMHEARSSGNIHLHFPKKEKIKNNLGKESEFINKSRQNRSLSLDSVY